MTLHLQDLDTGAVGYVRHLEGGRALIGRLASLGFTPGAPVRLLRKSSSGPLLVLLRGTQVALGQLEAQGVLISPAADDAAPVLPAVIDSRVVALAGQPNVGKSTVFNLLTGLNQHVGNWTGKTVEQKSGTYSFEHKTYTLVDLPGTYSLTANSEEERIARDYILRDQPDLVVAVVDAATLERNLYLLAELLLLPAPVILALNMMDVAQQEGIQVEPKVLESALGIPVVPMSAARGGQGLRDLQQAISDLLEGKLDYQPKRPTILPAHKTILDQLTDRVLEYVPAPYPVEWTAMKLLEGDEELSQKLRASVPPDKWDAVAKLLYQHEDAILDIAGARYEWIARMIRAAVVQPLVTRAGLTARLDRFLTHPVLGTLILMAILGLVFWLTYTIGSPLQAWLSQQAAWLADSVRVGMAGAPAWLIELFASGVLGGVGMVLTFLPILAIFYFSLGLLEDTGYLARAAYLSDRWMHQMGLHGKSFLPILLGFGCNVPAVYGTRIIESPRARLLTTLLIPLIPCTARMTVVAVLTPLFFGADAAWISGVLIGVNLLILALLGWLLHHFAFSDEHVAFIMELPLYHAPNLKTIGIYVWQNILGFLEKAGRVILVASLVIWALAYFPTGDMLTSYLGWFGRWLEPIGQWMGLPWPVMVATLTSVVAKENTIATLGILYGDIHVLPGLITPAAGLALLVFQMLFVPCIGTIAAIRQETHSLKWTIISVLLTLGLSIGAAVLVFQVGRLF